MTFALKGGFFAIFGSSSTTSSRTATSGSSRS